MKRSILYIFAIITVFAVALYFALAGVDYGQQWDANLIKGFVKLYVRDETILPGEYHYPPVNSYIASTALIPYALPLVREYGTNWIPTQRHLLENVLDRNNTSFTLNVRRAFVFVTMAAILWAGFAAAQKDWLAGVVAAAVLAFSWELSYQSRIIHPDGPTTQFVALSLFLAMLGFYKRRPFRPSVWFLLAAAAAAMATATKYTAGISLLVVLILAYSIFQETMPKVRDRLLWLAGVVAIYGVVFLLLVPGAILENSIFVYQLIRDQQIYASGHGGHTVSPGWDHLSRILSYLTQTAFSYYRFLAALVPALAMAGGYSLRQEKDRKNVFLLIALAGVPILYILFLATNRVLFVRNLIQLLPAISVLAGFGFSWLWQRLSKPVWRAALATGLGVLLVANIGWLNYTVSTIQDRRTDRFAEEALAAIAEADMESVYVTPAALALIGDHSLPANASTDFDPSVDLVLFAYRADTIDEREGSWPVNFVGASPQIFGSHDINVDWYANWPGVERLVLAPVDIAWQDGAPIVETQFAPIDIQEEQSASGTLVLDGEQFYIETDSARIFIMNSANPKIILALRDFVETEVSIAGQPVSAARPNDWFLISFNREQILGVDDLQFEYNSSRFLLNLEGHQMTCIREVVGAEQYTDISDTVVDLLELTELELLGISECAS
jgi:hypothetical protein